MFGFLAGEAKPLLGQVHSQVNIDKSICRFSSEAWSQDIAKERGPSRGSSLTPVTWLKKRSRMTWSGKKGNKQDSEHCRSCACSLRWGCSPKTLLQICVANCGGCLGPKERASAALGPCRARSPPSNDVQNTVQLPGTWSSTNNWKFPGLGLKAPGEQSHI